MRYLECSYQDVQEMPAYMIPIINDEAKKEADAAKQRRSAAPKGRRR